MIQIVSLNKFDRKFRELERRTGRDPSRIDWLVRNSPDVRRVVGALYFWDAEFRAYRFDKTHLETPSWFVSRYREYNERYSPQIQRIYGRLHLETLDQDQVDGIPAEEIVHPDGPLKSKRRFQIFVPAMRDGAEAVELVFRWAYNMSDGSVHEEELVRGVEAWDYFTETVGIDLARIEDRWAKLPRALVPVGQSEAVSDRLKAALLELLDNATKAYVFGLPAAAMAMCRAVCDLVLRVHFEVEGKSLIRKVIPLAEERYAWLKQLNLTGYVEFANRIMHEADRPLTEKEHETVCQFLETIKTLIERVPRPGAD